MTFLNMSLAPDPLQLSGENLHISVQLTFNITVELGTEDKPIEVNLLRICA